MNLDNIGDDDVDLDQMVVHDVLWLIEIAEKQM
jgi:hypothetical protein